MSAFTRSSYRPPESSAPRKKATPDQMAIRRDARATPFESRKVVAAAGSGKTTTLAMLANDRPDRGLYLAFNNSIKQEASQRFPHHIRCMTPHGLAFKAMRMFDYSHRLNQRIFSDRVTKLVSMPRCQIPEEAVGQYVLDTVARFCNSADYKLTIDHVALDEREPEANRMAVLEGARKLFARMSNLEDRDCPMTHDTYLKMWQLGNARIQGVEWALFDEAQDASPVMVDIMMRQGIPITWVGDPHQSIYQWRGAVNAMRTMDCKEFNLPQSFRFGQDVAEVANHVLACKHPSFRPNFTITGHPDKQTPLGRIPREAKQTFLSRTNSEWFLEALQSRGRVHVVGGIDETERLLMSAYNLWLSGRRDPRSHPSVGRFHSWDALTKHAETFDDHELMFAIKIVEKTFKSRLPQAISDLRRRHVQDEAQADLVLSTAHKSKGREWDNVRLGSGFIDPMSEEWTKLSPSLQEAELNLLYVSLTRAKQALQPNEAIESCIALATGKVKLGETPPPPPSRPVIRLPTETQPALPQVPNADQTPSQPRTNMTPPWYPQPRETSAGPRPSVDQSSPTPPWAQYPQADAVQSLADQVKKPAPWSPELDQTILDMRQSGLSVDAIAEQVDRSISSVAVRIEVLNGQPELLEAEVLQSIITRINPEVRQKIDFIRSQEATQGLGM